MNLNKHINHLPVWHDEERNSWTYCGKFEIIRWENIYALYRIQHDLGARNYNWIASFKTLEIAKTVTSIIRTNEI